MWNELFITYNGPSLFCELLANYTKSIDKQIIRMLKLKKETCELLNLNNLPFVTTPSGKKLTDHYEIGEFITTITGLNYLLIGRTDTCADSHKKFFKELIAAKNPYLYLNEKLAYNTFINNSNNITISDLYAYCYVLLDIIKFNNSDKYEFPNLCRWALHIQSLEGINNQISRLNMKLSLPYEKLYININSSLNLKDSKINDVTSNKQTKAEVSKPSKVLDPEKQKEIDKKIEQARLEKETKKKEKQNQPISTGQKDSKNNKQQKKEEDTRHPVSKLDIRVGKIVSIEVNKDSEKLYNEVIDFGNGLQRKIASGLKGKIDIELLRDSMVVCILNLKERTLCNWPSHGMLLCCNKDNSYDFIRPPTGSKPGDLVSFGNYPRQPDDVLNPKKNPWDLVKDKITINDKGVAVFDNESEWKTDKGIITSKLTNSVIS